MAKTMNDVLSYKKSDPKKSIFVSLVHFGDLALN